MTIERGEDEERVAAFIFYFPRFKKQGAVEAFCFESCCLEGSFYFGIAFDYMGFVPSVPHDGVGVRFFNQLIEYGSCFTPSDDEPRTFGL